MTMESIQETYNIGELINQRNRLKNMLSSASLSEEEKWEADYLLQSVNRRIRLLNDLLLGLDK
ncbi:hypothetical protein [Ammoniphilus resinae]|uniref:Uncharacterized protein n=1 Tax=Ammoniphilus resinae TaxID=861532 RepID=A0ABS4GS46_9BACL|nr:hypothetical protein [Ammoniphilus resinae]MBP1932952.1 hypothetical protein [Ammoniphilus resinae]